MPALPVERAPGTDAGMDKHIIAQPDADFQPLEEITVVWRQRRRHCLGQDPVALPRIAPLGQRDTIARKRRHAAPAQPVPDQRRLGHRPQEDVFVIPHQVPGRQTREVAATQMIEDSRDIRAAIDIVAQKDHAGIQPAVTCREHDLLFEAFQGLQTSMDITDGIYPDAFGEAIMPLSLSKTGQKLCDTHHIPHSSNPRIDQSNLYF